MPEDLHRSGHRERDYNRPNAKWICGHKCDGRECPLGPSSKGGCRGTGECLPVMKGDRWFCSRPESRGGECKPGPGPDGKCGCGLAPCRPVRSLRQLRKRFSIAAVILTGGFLLAVLSGKPPRDAAINAGQLTKAHAGENLDCSSCHVDTSITELGAVLEFDHLKHRAIANSELCLNCHGEEIGKWEESAKFAHGWTKESLGEKMQKAKERERTSSTDKADFALWLASKGPIVKNGAVGELACSTCHQEHHGANFELTILSDRQCQVCHEEQFHSFNDGHPTFASTDYPYSRRTRIFFDHESHFGNHFVDEAEGIIAGFNPENPFAGSESCQHCHESDAKGEFMKLKGYEASCSACHEDSVKGGDALTMLAIPEIDPQWVAGKWPRSSYGLSPVMRLILEGPTDDLVAGLNGEDEFGSVWLADDAAKGAAVSVAADLRSIGFESWQDGSTVLEKRLASNGFQSIGEDGELFGGLSVDTLRRFLFPGEQHSLSEITFPNIDLESVNQFLKKDGERSLGAWPENTAAPLTSLMLHLIEHRRHTKSAIQELRGRVGEDGSMVLNDLSDASLDELEAVERLAWEVKHIYAELETNGAPFLKEFELLHGGILDLESTADVFGKVFPIVSAEEGLGAKIETEVKNFERGIFPAAIVTKTAEPVESSSKDDGDDDFGGGDDDDFGAAAPAQEEKAKADDDFGGGDDDDFGAAAPAQEEKPKADDDFGGGDDDDFGAAAPAKEEKPKAKADDDFGGEDDDDFGAAAPAKEEKAKAKADDDFGGEDDDDFGAAAPAKEEKPKADDDFGGGDDDDFGAAAPAKEEKAAPDDDFKDEPKDADEAQEAIPEVYRVFEPDPADWHEAGGWFHENNAIRYRAKGHSDPIVRAWIESAVSAANSKDKKLATNARRVLEHTFQWKDGIKSAASGKCFKCHVIDKDPVSSELSVNWYGAYGNQVAVNPSSELTVFPHDKHFISMDCVNCHQPADKGSYADFFPSRDETGSKSNPKVYSSNFLPISEKTNCGNCHQESRAGNSCLQCHSYHSHATP